MKLMAGQVLKIVGTAEALSKVERDVQTKVVQIMDMIGVETVTFLRSLTNEMRPPARKGEGPRYAHPGHWADISGNLALSYGWEADPLETGGARLTLRAGGPTAPYAEVLEARDGFFVLSGVADRGGPVEEALIKAVGVIAPNWRVDR